MTRTLASRTGRARPPRVALYGHDTCGLGHLRRNLALAEAVRRAPGAPDVLVVSGSPHAQRFARPAGVDLLVLPSVAKGVDGRYRAGALDVPLDDVVDVRTAAAGAALRAWAPDLLVVDKTPGGFHGELSAVVRDLHRAGTRTVLGLRDVMDAPAVARAEWHRDLAGTAVRRHYDEVWVYGDADVHDLRPVLDLPADRTRYLGYLSHGRAPARPVPLPRSGSGRRTVLACVGGGMDGADLTRTLLRTPVPDGVDLVVLPGPVAATALADEVAAALAARPELVVVPFADDAAAWVAEADAVVCMGGYNPVAEVLATSTPALVVPRVRPRAEQQVRAEALARRGLLDTLDPADLSPAAVGDWLARALDGPRPARTGIRLDGLGAVTRRTGDLLAPAPTPLPLPLPTLEGERRAG